MGKLRETSRKDNAGIWKTLAERLSSSRKNRCSVNIQKINRCTKDGDTVVVPGKLLGDGVLDHKVVVAAFNFSESAKKKIESSGGKIMSIPELVKKNPKGSNVVIIG